MTSSPYQLPQKVDPAEQARRKAALWQARQDYEYIREPGQPPRIKNLPDSEAFSGAKKREFLADNLELKANEAVARIRMSVDPWNHLDDFEKLYALIRKPDTAMKHWLEDPWYGWMQLAGCNPMQLERVGELPNGLHIADADVQGLLPEGRSLQRCVEMGRIFLTSFPYLEGAHRMPGRYMAEPICLFQLHDDGRLLPLAIQLRQDVPHQGNPLFTPLDDHWDWVQAKAWVQNANAHYHEGIWHLLETHLVGEVVSIALHRNLASEHPLHVMLTPHLHWNLAINEMARDLLLSPGGQIDQTMSGGAKAGLELIAHRWATWHWEDRTLHADLASRGLDDSAVLPTFPYRDDGLLVHAAMRKYAHDLVRLFYGDDRDVLADFELQAFLRELGDPEYGTIKGLPAVRSIDTLVSFLADLLFRVTAQHAAVNNGQYDIYGFIPNNPVGMYAPLPKEKGKASEKTLMAMLPDKKHTLEQVEFAQFLSQHTHEPLVSFANPFADEDAAARVVAEFQERLEKVSTEIGRRNYDRFLPYTYLDPRTMAQSIAM